jgi:hypothetical protein
MKNKCSVLKWKLILILTSLILAVVLAILFWVRLSFEQYVREAEISSFKSTVIAALRIESKNYYTSRDDDKFNAAVAEVKRMNPDLSIVFISDENGGIVGDDSGVSGEVLGELDFGSSDGWNSPIDTDTRVDVGDDEYVLVSYKDKLDPYIIHFGFCSRIIAEHTQNLSRKVAFVAGLTAVVTILLGAAFLHIATRPIERLARDSEKLSFGDMSISLRRGSRTEVGRIYSSLSRLKESILYSLKRFDMR